MTEVRSHGYAHDVQDWEVSKQEALENLRENLTKKYRIWENINIMAGPRSFEPLVDHEVDISKVRFDKYRHGTVNIQATYIFEYPEGEND